MALSIKRISPTTANTISLLEELCTPEVAGQTKTQALSQGKSLNETPKKKSKLIKIIRKAANSTINISKAFVALGILSYVTLFKLPITKRAENEFYRYIGEQPAPYSLRFTDKYIDGKPVDRFIAQFDGFESIKEVIEREVKEGNLKSKDLDLDENGWIFDKPQEIKHLVAKLKSVDESKFTYEISLLELINTANQLIWGINSPNAYQPQQWGFDDCQVISALQAQLLTQENIQDIKARVRVTDFNPQDENFRIDTVIELDGRKFFIPYEALIKWMSPPGTALRTDSSDGSLFVPIFTCAIEQILDDYHGVPNRFTSAAFTLATGKDNGSILIESLSDDELIKILSKAPDTPTFITTKLHNISDSNIGNVKSSLISEYSYFFNSLRREEGGSSKQVIQQNEHVPGVNAQKESTIQYPTSSGMKEKDFTGNIQKYMQEIRSTNNDITLGANKILNEQTKRRSFAPDVKPQHAYAVKEFKRSNGQYVVTAIDCDTEFTLTLEGLRKHGRVIGSKSKNFPYIGGEGRQALLIGLFSILAVFTTAHKLNLKINPEYKSSLVKICRTLLKGLRLSG